MKKKLIHKHAIIKKCTEDNDDFIRLYHIFRLTLKREMSYRQFRFYYNSLNLEYIDVTFFYDDNNIAGFCAAAFYSFNSTDKKGALGRSATGLLEEYQGESLPKWTLYAKYIRYKLAHPFIQLTLTAYVANPLIYSMICKYTGIVYPKFTTQVPEKLMKIKQKVLTASGLQHKEKSPFVVQIHFDVQKGEKLRQRIAESANVHVQFFIGQTQMQERVTLLVIIPVSLLNITFTTGLFIKHNTAKIYIFIITFFLNQLLQKRSKCMEIINLVTNYFRKPGKRTEYGN